VTCVPLPGTGLDGQVVLLVLVVGLAGVIGGGMILLVRRRRRAGLAVASLAILMLVAGAALVPAARAEAATSACAGSGDSLTVVQTSTMQGLAPGVDPVAIAGVVVNNGADRTRIAAVDVEITSVTTSRDSSIGVCDTSDYRIVQPRMTVARALEPGGSATFTGAFIGFNDKPSIQDACQHAVVHLLYTVNPR
jgi:hypothetical protein